MSSPADAPTHRLQLATALFYGGLILASLIVAAPTTEITLAMRQWALALSFSIGVWSWIGFVDVAREWPASDKRSTMLAVSAAFLTLLWNLLIVIHKAYYLMLPGLFGFLFATLPFRWSAVGGLLLTIVVLIHWIVS